eukprot:gene9338-1604_t
MSPLQSATLLCLRSLFTSQQHVHTGTTQYYHLFHVYFERMDRTKTNDDLPKYRLTLDLMHQAAYIRTAQHSQLVRVVVAVQAVVVACDYQQLSCLAKCNHLYLETNLKLN